MGKSETLFLVCGLWTQFLFWVFEVFSDKRGSKLISTHFLSSWNPKLDLIVYQTYQEEEKLDVSSVSGY